MNSPNARRHDPEHDPWHLVLFVARESAASAMAVVQLKRIAAEYLPPTSTVEVVDLFDEPERAEEEQILAIPTLVRKVPRPVRRVIGDLSDIPRVLTSIGFVANSSGFSLA
ncbi:MAG TPA: circadian clock KaiB family protein [Verrucomicrobiae bacterium]